MAARGKSAANRVDLVKNRIRHIRAQRGLTQAELARRLRTTPATISRLETNQMSVSTDWLERIAQALNADPSDLVGSTRQPALELLGNVMRYGRVIAGGQDWYLDPPSKNAVAARIAQNQGIYAQGEVVIGEKLPSGSNQAAIGKDCLCALADQTVMLARIAGDPDRPTLIPPEPGSPILYKAEIAWLAPITYRITQIS